MVWGLPAGEVPPVQYTRMPLEGGAQIKLETLDRRPSGRAPGPWPEKFSRRRAERAVRTNVNSVAFRSAGQGADAARNMHRDGGQFVLPVYSPCWRCADGSSADRAGPPAPLTSALGAPLHGHRLRAGEQASTVDADGRSCSGPRPHTKRPVRPPLRRPTFSSLQLPFRSNSQFVSDRLKDAIMMHPSAHRRDSRAIDCWIQARLDE
jgi:hypothetical protein